MTEFLDPDHEAIGDAAGDLIDPDTNPNADAISISAAARRADAGEATGSDKEADGEADGSAG